MKLAHQTQPTPQEDFDVVTKGYVDDIANKSVEVLDFANRVTHVSETPLVVGAFEFDPVDFRREGMDFSVTFRAVAANGDLGFSSVVSLFNVTDSDLIDELVVSGTDQTKYEQTLTLGTGTGEIDDGPHLYEVSIRLNAPPAGPTETIEVYSVELRVVNELGSGGGGGGGGT